MIVPYTSDAEFFTEYEAECHLRRAAAAATTTAAAAAAQPPTPPLQQPRHRSRCRRRRRAAAAAAANRITILLRIGFPDDTSPESIKKVMTNVGPWFTNKGYKVECVNADTVCITCQPNHVEKLMQPRFQHRMKGVNVVFHEVKTTSYKEQEQEQQLWLEQQLHELEEQVHKAEVNQLRLFLLITEVEHMRLIKQFHNFIMIFTHMKRWM